MYIVVSIIVLAVLQGIAEFLPVSSSGHLLTAGSWFGFDAEENLMLNVVLHAGTLLAILVFYFRRILSILLEPERRRLIALVIVGSIPAAAVGVGLKITHLDEKLFSSVWVAALGFAITGTMLLKVFGLKEDKANESDGAVPSEKMTFLQALLIGCAQAIAIMPGISRSGSTISAAVKLKLRKSDAAEFSFLLAIPAIGGAALLEVLKIVKSSDQTALANGYGVLLLGFIVSAAVGYGALAGLIAMLQKGKLGWFACYLYAAAAVAAAVEIFRMF